MIRRQRTPVGDGNQSVEAIYQFFSNNQKIENPSRGRKLIRCFCKIYCYSLEDREPQQGTETYFVLFKSAFYFIDQKIENPSRGRKLFCQCVPGFQVFIRRQRTPVGDGNQVLYLTSCHYLYQKIENPSRGRKQLTRTDTIMKGLEDREPQQGTETLLLKFQQLLVLYQKIENPSRGRKHLY